MGNLNFSGNMPYTPPVTPGEYNASMGIGMSMGIGGDCIASASVSAGESSLDKDAPSMPVMVLGGNNYYPATVQYFYGHTNSHTPSGSGVPVPDKKTMKKLN